MPLPPATERATKPTRQSSGSMPLYSASPPQTPPTILSVRLRRSGRPGGGASAGDGPSGDGSMSGGAGGSALVMAQSLLIGATAHIREAPHPTLAPYRGSSPCRAGVSRCDDRHVSTSAGAPPAAETPAAGTPPRPPLV